MSDELRVALVPHTQLVHVSVVGTGLVLDRWEAADLGRALLRAASGREAKAADGREAARRAAPAPARPAAPSG
jgi:hypothetical protein